MKNVYFFLLVLLSFYSTAQDNPVEAHRLLCEYLEKPLAIDMENPRFTWQMKSSDAGAKQTAYRIIVGRDSLEVAHGIGKSWDSKIQQGNQQLALYGGEVLKAYTNYYWAVELWDEKNKQGKRSAVSSFRTGNKGQWKGQWISDTRDINRKPAAYFRTTFKTEKKVKTAFVYIAVAGLFEMEINGQKVGDHVLDPIYTRFDRRNLYVVHDITTQIKNENAISVLLGNGWYNHQSTAVWYFHEVDWRARPRFCLDLRIEYEDGSIETISSSEAWKTSLSPVVFNSIYTGEHYDATKEQPGHSTYSFNDSSWNRSWITPAPSDKITPQLMHPIRATSRIPAVSMRKLNDRHYIFDLGQNFAGVSEIRVSGKRGTVLRLKHAEILDSSGQLDMRNIEVHYRPTDESDPFQTDIYTLKGEGEEVFYPHFNYKGFQYVEVVSSEPIELTKESLVGIKWHSDVPQRGNIETTNPYLMKLWKATNQSYLSNLFGYPTDCPQREKNGWTGDGHIASETGLYNFDGITIYEKWIQDHRDEQQANGLLPAIVPTDGWGYSWANGPDWTSSMVLIPWNIYLYYGDPQILEKSYDNMKRYVELITEKSENNLTSWGLGDWIPVTTKPPVEFTSSVYYFVDADILAKTAAILGKQADSIHYSQLAQAIKKAFNEKFFNPETKLYGTGSQTELSMPLYWNLVPQEYKSVVADRLAQQVQRDQLHVNVGLLGSKAILNALSKNGYADLAYTLLTQKDYPGWGWWMSNGLTSLPENWNLTNTENDISYNHIMFGEVSAWMYKALAGIQVDEEHPGFEEFIFAPCFVRGLNDFDATFQSPRGNIAVTWKRKNDQINIVLQVPANSRALFYLGDYSVKDNIEIQVDEDNKYYIQLEAGIWEFDLHK